MLTAPWFWQQSARAIVANEIAAENRFVGNDVARFGMGRTASRVTTHNFDTAKKLKRGVTVAGRLGAAVVGEVRAVVYQDDLSGQGHGQGNG